MEQFTHSSLGHQLHRVFRLNGPVKNVSAACATGSASLILASKWIEEGVCDMVLAGACESSLYPLYVAGFDNMGVLAKERVCPFSLDRQGFAVGEGAGIFVLERKDKAMMRGANIYAEIAGCSMANDARGAVNSDPGGLAISEAIIKSMNKSGFQEIDYINAHGTGTRLNDLIETKAIKKAFSGKEGRISVSSTKAATGHLLGASGAVEAAFCMLSLRDQVVPATLNLLNRDPECDLDYTPNSAKRRLVRSAMSLSFGFGGQITSIVAGR
jgi:3-oxoacyl-(acyl-carrier-protein) synthase